MKTWTFVPRSDWTAQQCSQWEALTGLIFGWKQTPERLAYSVAFLGALRGVLLFLRHIEGGPDARTVIDRAWNPLERFDAPRAWGAIGVLFCDGGVLDAFARMPAERRRAAYQQAITYIDHTMSQISEPG